MRTRLIVSILFVTTGSVFAQKALNSINIAARYQIGRNPNANFLWLDPNSLLISYTQRTEDEKVGLLVYNSYRAKKPTRNVDAVPKCEDNQCMIHIESLELLDDEVLVLKIFSEEENRRFVYDLTSTFKNYSPILLKNKDNTPILTSYVGGKQKIIVETVGSEEEIHVYYYAKKFNFADPPTRILNLPGKNFIPDTLYQLMENDVFSPTRKGLYFMQADTTLAGGYSFRLEGKEYPSYNSLVNLRECMRYITTTSEWRKLNVPNLSKVDFDNVWLKMAGNEIGAKKAIREYFRRIRSSNRFFTTYKEGWKTDMGMIYTIFGPPDEVYMKKYYEVWKYEKTPHHDKLEFSFKKILSPFSQRHFILIRGDEYKLDWHRTVDLVRKGMDQ